MTEYPAITVYQPWASLIAIGAKPFEYRAYPAPAKYVGKRIAIHAAARPMVHEEVRQLLEHIYRGERTRPRDKPALDMLRTAFQSIGITGPPVLPFSAVVCLVTLGSPTVAAQLGLHNDSGRAAHSRWAWPLTDIEPIDGPHPYFRGRQGWFYWQDHRV
jgi:hypothetical protein